MRTLTLAIAALLVLLSGCGIDQHTAPSDESQPESDQMAVKRSPTASSIWDRLTPEFLADLRTAYESTGWLEHTFEIPFAGGQMEWVPGSWDPSYVITVDMPPVDPIAGMEPDLSLTVRISNGETPTPGNCLLFRFTGNMLDHAPETEITLTSAPWQDENTLFYHSYTLLPETAVSLGSPGYANGAKHNKASFGPLSWTPSSGGLITAGGGGGSDKILDPEKPGED